MEQKIFTGVLTSVPHKYYLIQHGETWSKALASCRSNLRDLATIENVDDLVKIQAEAQSQGFESSAWIGLYKVEHDWTWSNGNETLGRWTQWRDGEPDNSIGFEDCGMSCSGPWSDAPCKVLLPFVCFDETRTGDDRYVLYSTKKSWYEAQTFCRLHHNDLASMKDNSQYSIIKAFSLEQCTWIGLTKVSWEWSSHASVSSIMWRPVKPDSSLAFQNCGAYQPGLEINDDRCDVIKPFFCSAAITGQHQVIRIKVWSAQDMKHPAVKALLLEQIQRKLKVNVKVKFKEQPEESWCSTNRSGIKLPCNLRAEKPRSLYSLIKLVLLNLLKPFRL